MNSDDNHHMFRDAMGDVTPLKKANNVHWLHPTTKKAKVEPIPLIEIENFLTRGFLDIVSLDTPLEFKVEGIQQGVLDKLRQGKYPLDASLNLLRQPVEQCRIALFEFINDATRDNLRNLLIIHGKGREDESHANIVRSYLARWLREFDQVQAFCVAQLRHGGSGACYVALRKSAVARQENGERHAKHSR